MSRSTLRNKSKTKRNDKVIQQKEHLYAILETARDAVVSADQSGKFIFWNRMAEEMFGYTAEEAIGKPLTLIMPKRFRAKHTKGIKRFLSTGKSRIIGKVLALSGLRKKGQEFPLELSLSSWKAGKKVYFTAIIRDTTERQLTNESLVLFRSLIDQTHDAVFLINPKTGQFLDVNRKACQNLKYTKNKLLTMSVFSIEAVIPDKQSWDKHVQNVKKKGNVILEGRHKRKDGSTFPVEVSVNYVQHEMQDYMIAIVRDITERKRMEAERNAMLDNIPVNIMMLDRNMSVRWVNDSMAAQFGFKPKEMIGESWYDLVPPMKKRKAIYKKVLSGQKNGFL